jgi:hypothetical protein
LMPEASAASFFMSDFEIRLAGMGVSSDFLD